MEPSKQTLPEMSRAEGEKVADLCARLGVSLETALALATDGRMKTDRRVVACELAIERAGGAKVLAKKLGISRQAIAHWQIVPLERVKDVERHSGISRRVLRPDFFDDEEAAA